MTSGKRASESLLDARKHMSDVQASMWDECAIRPKNVKSFLMSAGNESITASSNFIVHRPLTISISRIFVHTCEKTTLLWCQASLEVEFTSSSRFDPFRKRRPLTTDLLASFLWLNVQRPEFPMEKLHSTKLYFGNWFTRSRFWSFSLSGLSPPCHIETSRIGIRRLTKDQKFEVALDISRFYWMLSSVTFSWTIFLNFGYSKADLEDRKVDTSIGFRLQSLSYPVNGKCVVA
jgi:hypothetical protein